MVLQQNLPGRFHSSLILVRRVSGIQEIASYGTDVMGVDALARGSMAVEASVASDAKHMMEPIVLTVSQSLPSAMERLAMEDDEQEQEDEEQQCRRRTSIPPTFAFGADVDDSEALRMGERRWRSFDCNGSPVSRAASLELLTSRIQQEQQTVDKRTSRMKRRREWMRSVGAMFSSSRKEQVKLLQMQLVAEVAACNRSLAILNDMKTLVLTMGDEEDDIALDVRRQSRAESRSGSFSVDSSNAKLLEGIENADKLLAEDNVHHILNLQAQWLKQLIAMHADKSNNVGRAHGTSTSAALQQFLSEFCDADGTPRLPCAFDAPTTALVRFEKLISRYQLMKSPLKNALDELCQDTMASFIRVRSNSSSRATQRKSRVFDERDPVDVMPSLVREIIDAINEEASVPERLRKVLRSFVEQMVFSRLACACYRDVSVEMDEANSTWRDQVLVVRELSLHDVGLPVEVDVQTPALFEKTIEAINRMPHLVPSSVLAAFLSAIRVLYREAEAHLGLSSTCISADVLLPLLVFVLSRANLPHLQSQVFIMQQYGIDASQEGSEAAYYLACLQAAMGYIMGFGKPTECE